MKKPGLVNGIVDPVLKNIHLIGTVSEDMYHQLLDGLLILKDEPEINIFINTYGGDMYQSLAIYDVIKGLRKMEVNIICVGPVMSAGMIILQAGSKRYASQNSQLMVHYGEDVNDSLTTAQQNKKLFTLMKKIIGERVTVSKRTINNWFKSDTFFTASEAKRYGLIDEVLK